MNIVADTHTHTLICDHAYSTLTENMRQAAEIGLRFLCITEHTNTMPGAPHYFFFENLRSLPESMFGVYLVRGCEVNILNQQGELDLPEGILSRLEWVIASLHDPCFSPKQDPAVYTQAWLSVAENPHVDVIGHCGNGKYPFDYQRVIPAFGAGGKIVEINAHSFVVRAGSRENCLEIAKLCKKHQVPVVVSTDAHFHQDIGVFTEATEALASIDFPEELILNADYDRFARVVTQKCGRQFPRL